MLFSATTLVDCSVRRARSFPGPIAHTVPEAGATIDTRVGVSSSTPRPLRSSFARASQTGDRNPPGSTGPTRWTPSLARIPWRDALVPATQRLRERSSQIRLLFRGSLHDQPGRCRGGAATTLSRKAASRMPPNGRSFASSTRPLAPPSKAQLSWHSRGLPPPTSPPKPSPSATRKLTL